MQVILFDGVCNLCNGIVQFIIRRDKFNHFHFASLQSSFGEEVTKHFKLPAPQYETIVLYDRDMVYFKSDAVIRVLTQLPGAWKLSAAFKIVPKFIRDYLYDRIAKSRYRVFGKRDHCMIPTAEQKEKFVDEKSFNEFIS